MQACKEEANLAFHISSSLIGQFWKIIIPFLSLTLDHLLQRDPFSYNLCKLPFHGLPSPSNTSYYSFIFHFILCLLLLKLFLVPPPLNHSNKPKKKWNDAFFFGSLLWAPHTLLSLSHTHTHSTQKIKPKIKSLPSPLSTQKAPYPLPPLFSLLLIIKHMYII